MLLHVWAGRTLKQSCDVALEPPLIRMPNPPNPEYHTRHYYLRRLYNEHWVEEQIVQIAVAATALVIQPAKIHPLDERAWQTHASPRF